MPFIALTIIATFVAYVASWPWSTVIFPIITVVSAILGAIFGLGAMFPNKEKPGERFTMLFFAIVLISPGAYKTYNWLFPAARTVASNESANNSAPAIVVNTTMSDILVDTSNAGGSRRFVDETNAIADLVKCPTPKVTKTQGLPDLWECILPKAEVLKIFVNATDDNSSVSNVKIMWNDWTRDIGYGVHTDREQAEAWVTALATRYAPESVQEVLNAFRGNRNTNIQGKGAQLKYTYFKGPAIDERLITVTLD
ncbi:MULTISPECIES: hypothetical protein [unclassified Pannonibacter]|uniref:hypothetical protein n=1 Tax=unclassified Pannonibacter TaxID=2627228 RepID=UPI0016492A27|nr:MULTISPECIES: hypothetical protein [unclassified Pannonibacter]